MALAVHPSGFAGAAADTSSKSKHCILRRLRSGCPDAAHPPTDHADNQDAVSSQHCMDICRVTNRPGASEPDWLELILEV